MHNLSSMHRISAEFRGWIGFIAGRCRLKAARTNDFRTSMLSFVGVAQMRNCLQNDQREILGFRFANIKHEKQNLEKRDCLMERAGQK